MLLIMISKNFVTQPKNRRDYPKNYNDRIRQTTQDRRPE